MTPLFTATTLGRLRLLAPPPPRRTRPQVFQISIVRPDGTTHTLRRTGGQPCDHAQEGMDIAGIGGVVRVTPLTELEAA